MISRTSKAQLIALCPGHDTQDGALTQALKELWATHVLDTYALRAEWSRMPSPELFGGRWTFRGLDTGSGFMTVRADTPAAARLATAEALVAEDPTLSPKGWP